MAGMLKRRRRWCGRELVRHFMVRGVWNLVWSTGLGVLAVTLLRRQRERILFVLRWGRLPFEAGPTADDTLIVRPSPT